MKGDGKRSSPLHLITIGRAGVDMYGAQICGRLEDMSSFGKAISRAGDEHMRRTLVFAGEDSGAEGCSTGALTIPPRR